MNRRKAIAGLIAGGAGIVTAVGGYKWYQVIRKPEVEFIVKNSELIAALADIILPETDTPGARSVGAHLYVVTILTDCTDRKTQNNFINGLKDVESRSSARFGKPFEKLSLAEKTDIVSAAEKDSMTSSGILNKIKSRLLGKSFFSVLKEYTVEGYCLSKTGATQVLAYVAVPGIYSGCEPLKPGQNSWALR
jgi:hypothetical protein